MGGNGPPGSPGVKVNAALFDMDPIIVFIISHFKSTITAWKLFCPYLCPDFLSFGIVNSNNT